jgi:hypothetical protein
VREEMKQAAGEKVVRGKFPPVWMTMVARHSNPGLSFHLTPQKRPLCSGDGFWAPDTVLGCVGPKKALGRATGDGETSGVPQIDLGDPAGDALLPTETHFGARF